MPRRIRKIIVYVCTLDGSIHRTRKEAKDHLALVEKREAPRKARKRLKRVGGRRPGSTAVMRVLRAIHEGAVDAAGVRARTSVEPRILHPTLSNLRKRKLITGMSGDLKLTSAGRAKLGV